jgi:hypothetical protein
MSAIITEKFRRNNTKRFLEDIGDTPHYVGIGQSNEWHPKDGLVEDDAEYNVDQPLGTFSDAREVLNNLTTLIGIVGNSTSQVIPNIAAKSNNRHKAYNPFDPDCFYQTVVNSVLMFPCYVVVNNNVYVCLREPTAVSGPYALPNGSSLSRTPVVNADGSVWLYVYSVLPEFPVRGSQFVTVPNEPTLNGVETESTIEGATGNLVYGFTVMNGGSGYSSAPTAEFVPFDNPGSPVALVVTTSANTVTKVTYGASIIDNPAAWIKKPGYVRLSGGSGSGARVFPNIAPVGGFGLDPSEDLPSWYAGIVVDAEEEIFGDGAFIPYRQASIVRNPGVEVGVVDAELSLNCLQYIEFDASQAPSPSANVTGERIIQGATGATAIADYYVGSTRRLYYHQTYDTGFTAFNDSDTVTIALDEFLPTDVGDSEYVKESGELLFVQNRKKITRAGGQTEELTLILQF